MAKAISNSDRVMFTQAENLLQEGEATEAFFLLEELYERHPDAPEVASLFLRAALNGGEIDTALHLAREFQKSRLDQPEVQFGVAEAFGMAGFPGLALGELRSIRTDLLSRHELASIRDLTKQLTENFVDMPAQPEGSVSRETLQLKCDLIRLSLFDREFKRALGQADDFVKLVPNLGLAYSLRALVLSALSEVETAAQVAERALELDPSDAHALCILTRCRFLLGEPLITSRDIDGELAPDVILDYLLFLTLERRFTEVIRRLEAYDRERWLRSPNAPDFLHIYGFALSQTDELEKLNELRQFVESERLPVLPRSLGDFACAISALIPGRILKNFELSSDITPELLAQVEKWCKRYEWMPRLGHMAAAYSDDDGVGLALAILIVTKDPELQAALLDVATGNRLPFGFRTWLAEQLDNYGFWSEELKVKERTFDATFSDWGTMKVSDRQWRHVSPEAKEVCDRLSQLAQQDRHMRVEKICREAIEKFPTEPLLYDALGASLWMQREVEQAEDVLIEAAKRFPHDFATRTSLMNIYLDQDRMHEAERILREIFRIQGEILESDMVLVATGLMRFATKSRKNTLAAEAMRYLKLHSTPDENLRNEMQEVEDFLELEQKRASTGARASALSNQRGQSKFMN